MKSLFPVILSSMDWWSFDNHRSSAMIIDDPCHAFLFYLMGACNHADIVMSNSFPKKTPFSQMVISPPPDHRIINLDPGDDAITSRVDLFEQLLQVLSTRSVVGTLPYTNNVPRKVGRISEGNLIFQIFRGRLVVSGRVMCGLVLATFPSDRLAYSLNDPPIEVLDPPPIRNEKSLFWWFKKKTLRVKVKDKPFEGIVAGMKEVFLCSLKTTSHTCILLPRWDTLVHGG